MNRALAVAIGIAVLAPAVALAKPRVAIVTFDGDGASSVQDVVADLLDGDFTVVSRKQVTRALDKLGLDPADLSSKKLKKLAKELDAESIVRGELTEKGKHKVLHLKLFVHGKRVHGFKIEYGSSKSKKFKDALRDKLVGKLENGDAEPEEQPAEPPEDTENADKAEKADKSNKGDKGDKSDKGDKGDKSDSTDSEKSDEGASSGDEADAGDKPDKKSNKKKSDDEAAEGDDGDSKSSDDEDKPRKHGKKRTGSADDEGEVDGEGGISGGMTSSAVVGAANRSGARVDFGLSFASRTLAFSSRQFEEAPKPYSNSPVPGARVSGELYPLAFSKPQSFLGGLGIGGDFDQTLSLNVQSTVQTGTKFPVKQNHFSVGPRVRIVFGHKATSPSVTLGVGYTSRTFKVDRTKLEMGNVIDLPDVGYKGYDAGLSFRIGITPKIAVVGGGRGIFVTTTGAIQASSQYGQAKVTGAGGDVGVDIGIGKRMAVTVTGDFCQMGFAFTGTGQMAINRDGDPSTKDVGGAADRYIGAAATFGVFY